MQSCDLQSQAAVAGNAEQANMFSAKCDDLMDEYEKINESLMETLRGEKVWADMVAECFLSQTPPTLPTSSLQAPTDGRHGAGSNAAPNVRPKEEEFLTEITDSRRLLTLEWYSNNLRRRARVVVIEPLGNLCVPHSFFEFFERLTQLCRVASSWPHLLLLELIQPATSINRFLTWMKECTTETTNIIEPVAGRFRPASEADTHNFALLVNFLRDSKYVKSPGSHTSCLLTIQQNAAASWIIRGKDVPTRNLLLAPLGQDLLCAAFPVSGLPGLPQGHQPQVQAHMGFYN